MMRSMFAAITGLRNHQTRMDVIGNNIANVNTVAFKASRVNFRELFSQTLQGASRPTRELGGTNPMQVGLGMTVGEIARNVMPGNLQPTGVETDLAIAGNGYFILRDGSSIVYTRAGTFGFDAEGTLVDRATGVRVQGWQARNGVLPEQSADRLTNIEVKLGEKIEPRATTAARLIDNLDAGAAVGDEVDITLDVFDSLGNARAIRMTFVKQADNQWSWHAYDLDGNQHAWGYLDFTDHGAFDAISVGNGSASVNGSRLTLSNIPAGGAAALTFAIEFGDVTQFAGESGIRMFSQDGYPSGELVDFSIDAQGVITGTYSNGVSRTLAQIALASFENPAALMAQGDNYFAETNNSGARRIGTAGTEGRGLIRAATLEMSNVDLAQEFTDMIATQRGFQANARMITVSDELLHELTNLKR